MSRNLFNMTALIICMSAVGCGGGDVPRYDVTGTATFSNKPIDNGVIYFDPDGAGNVSGLQGFAPIKNGKYNTAEGGKGITGGAYKVRVEGYGPVDASVDPPTAKALFTPYTFKEDFPKTQSTKDVNVPLSAANQAGITPKANVGP